MPIEKNHALINTLLAFRHRDSLLEPSGNFQKFLEAEDLDESLKY